MSQTTPFFHSDFNWLNVMKHECHTLAIEKGWYDKEETEEAYVARCVANFHGEISELWEAYRSGSMNSPCDKADKMLVLGINPPLSCIEEELADIIIRVLDMAGRLGVDIGRATALKHQFNQSRPYRHGNKKA